MEKCFENFDVVEMIFGQLDLASLNRCAKVCQSWKALINQGGQVWMRKIREVMTAHPRESTGKTELHWAAEQGLDELCQALVQVMEIKSPNDNTARWTPLHLAALNGHLKTCHTLLLFLDDVNPRDAWGRTPLHWAAIKGNAGLCRVLMMNNKTVISAKDQDHWTPLHYAADFGHLMVVNLLLPKMVEKNPRDFDGWTPLHSAATNGHLGICQTMLFHWPRGFVTDDFGRTPYTMAQANEQMDVVRFFEERLEMENWMCPAQDY